MLTKQTNKIEIDANKFINYLRNWAENEKRVLHSRQTEQLGCLNVWMM